ncbi:hypothetical protein COCON_G00064840 [Conger conger]|uniref:Uncharacterized protein n=1 Tax=Conger conger TaxID=82655 RepID=A0A9Q1DS20_CONCO|nr:hypothetical protein COCON_G00064840 [Conger conger]
MACFQISGKSWQADANGQLYRTDYLVTDHLAVFSAGPGDVWRPMEEEAQEGGEGSSANPVKAGRALSDSCMSQN